MKAHPDLLRMVETLDELNTSVQLWFANGCPVESDQKKPKSSGRKAHCEADQAFVDYHFNLCARDLATATDRILALEKQKNARIRKLEAALSHAVGKLIAEGFASRAETQAGAQLLEGTDYEIDPEALEEKR